MSDHTKQNLMKRTVLNLFSCCLLAVMASCGGRESTSETTTILDSPAVIEEAPKQYASAIPCPECSEASLCTPECLDAVLACHLIDSATFNQMTLGSGFNGGGHSPKTVAQIRNIVNTLDCRDHRILIEGNHADQQTDADIKFKVIKVPLQDSIVASVSYNFPLFKKIITQHNPSGISFFKAAKNDMYDIVIGVTTTSGAKLYYDLSDIPPVAYEEVPITD